MNIKTALRSMLPLVLGACVVWLAVVGLGVARAQTGTLQAPSAEAPSAEAPSAAAPSAAAAINRPQDPVMVPGAGFTGFSDVPLDELVLYAYQSGAWTPIPFQIDEVNVTGTYVVSDGGRLDDNDELVFMAGDTGDSVGQEIWPDDPESKLYPRYEISITDPLSPGDRAWVYLYRSATLTRSGISYLVWDEPAQTATAISYTAVFTPAEFLGLADLRINGTGVDILDRQKFRAEVFSGLIRLNEEFLATVISAPLTLPAVGPVRAVTNDGDLNVAFYGSRIDFDVSFDLSVLGSVLPDFIRTSFDWNDPSVTGITTYYDSNTGAGVSIDGIPVPDAVPSTPPMDWFQVSGGPGGPGGVVLAIASVYPSGGTLSNYYKDEGTIDLDDTGDQRSYADAGLRIDGPGAIIEYAMAAYISPPGTTANVGVTYFDRLSNPLDATVVPVTTFTHLPLIMKDCS